MKEILKAGIISLGCAKNLVDTEVMLGIMQSHGVQITPNPAEADILVVNTCAFIASTKEESITTILNFSEYKDAGNCKSLIVAGCLGQRYQQELLEVTPLEIFYTDENFYLVAKQNSDEPKIFRFDKMDSLQIL